MTGGLGWQPSPTAWLAAFGAALAVGVAISAFQRVKHVRFAKAMLAARLIALLLLAVAAFMPTLDVNTTVASRRQLVCVLDDSLSMAQIDKRNEGPALRSAEALGFIAPAPWSGDGLIEQAKRFWMALSDVESARAQRDQAKLADRPAEAEQQKVDDLSAALRAAAAKMLSTAQGDANTRFAVDAVQNISKTIADPSAALPGRAVEDLLDDLDRHQRQAAGQRARQNADASAAAKRVQAMSRYDLATATISRLTTLTQADAVAAIALLDGSSASVPAAQPTRKSSPLTAALAAAVDRVGADNCEGVVLLSDGRSTEARPGLSPALLSAGVPIYAVSLATPQNDPDVRIAQLITPPSVLAGEAVPVRVVVQNRNGGTTSVHVKLTDGKTTLQRDLPLTNGPDTIDFTWPAAALPSLHLTATLDPIAGEQQKDNNSAETTVAVIDQKVRVTLIAGSAGWDVQYLRNALARSPWVTLQQQILEAGEKCRFSPKEIANSDVIVLADVQPSAFDEKQAAAVEITVTKDGHSALLLPGDAEWLATIAQTPQLAGLVPQRIGETPAWRLPPSETPTVQPVPSGPAESLPLLKLDDALDVSMNRWLARPRLYRYVSVGDLKPQARPLLVDRSTQSPLIVEQALGAGRSMAVLIDEAWRWRASGGADANDRFWLNVIRELVDPPMTKTQGDLALGIDRDPQPAGQPMNIRIRVPAADAGKARLSLVADGKTLSTVTPNELLPGSGRLRAAITPDTAGPAELMLKVGEAELRLPLTITDSTAEELADTSGDPGLLNRVAQQTGGMMVTLDSLDKLPPQIALRRQSRVDTIHLDLWSSPYWFAAVVACLGLEWAMRKIAGMV